MTLLRRDLRRAIERNDLPALQHWLTPTARRPLATINAQLAPPDVLESAWLFAVRHGTPEALALLAPRVDTTVRTDVGNTALMIAAVENRARNAQALLQHWPQGNDPRVRNSGHNSALDLAALNAHTGVVEVLLAHPSGGGQALRAFQNAVAGASRHRRWTSADRLALDLAPNQVDLVVRTHGEEHFPRWCAQQEALALRAVLDATPDTTSPGGRVRSRL